MDNVLEIKNLKKIYHTKEGETLAVDGLVEEEIITVNNVVYNEIVL